MDYYTIDEVKEVKEVIKSLSKNCVDYVDNKLTPLKI